MEIAMKKQKLSREELATIEVGNTEISKRLSVVISICFLILIFIVPTGQQILSGMSEKTGLIEAVRDAFAPVLKGDVVDGTFVDRVKNGNEDLLTGFGEFEELFEDESYLRGLFLVPVQKFLLLFGKGNEKVFPGKDRWLFYSKDVEHLLVKEHTLSPVAAIIEFRDKLREQGVELLLMPTPLKPAIHPEMFSGRDYKGKVPLYHSSWQEQAISLQEHGVQIFDPAPMLVEYHKKQGGPVYLETDTHWTPAAMEHVAENLAGYIINNFQLDGPRQKYKRIEQTITGQGDIDAMLQLPGDNDLLTQEVVIHQVNTVGDELWQSVSEGSILLLGDSFSNIYSLAGMNWGQGAGFAEQLSYYLGLELDTILQNDAGAYATREKLAKDLAQGRDRLQGKKLVIWQFASRELTQGEWKSFDYQFKPAEPGEFYVVPAGEKKRITAEIAGLSRSPRPGSVPYKDNIVTLHLDNVIDLDSGVKLGSCLVYTWGMQNNDLQEITTMRKGDAVSMELVDWLEVEMEYASYRRSTLDDEMIEYELPNWGILLP